MRQADNVALIQLRPNMQFMRSTAWLCWGLLLQGMLWYDDAY